MAPATKGGNEFDPAAVERVEWLVQRDLAAPVPAAEPPGGELGSTGRWLRFLRGGHAPRFRAPDGIEVTPVDAESSESFGATAAFGLGLPAPVESVLAALPGRPGWRCYVTSAGGGTGPAAAATFLDGPIALLAIDATAESGRRGPARTALLHQAIDDAVGAGARLIGARVDADADSPRKEAAAGLLLAGFAEAYRCPPWVDAAVPAS